MAKKTSYLTELIERHERWKAEGGERLEDEEQDLVSDLYVILLSLTLSHTNTCTLHFRSSSGDPEDLWDFGTVRHASRPTTIGRSQNPIQVSGPPLTWENNGTARSDGSSNSSTTRRGTGSRASFSKQSSSMAGKGELPPLPPPALPPPELDQQATVRHLPAGGAGSVGSRSSQRTVQREPSDEYEVYDDQYPEPYPSHDEVLQQTLGQVQLEDDLPDTTMLDSVILPAIASVSCSTSSCALTSLIHFILCAALPPSLLAGSASSS